MKKTALIFLLLFFFINFSEASVAEKPKEKSLASFELGVDSLARRYFRPLLKLEFPLVEKTTLFFSFSHYQSTNKKLEGLVDFWIRGGLSTNISDTFDVEVSINHMSRHITSQNQPKIFDVNDLISRLWLKKENFALGLGGGLYLGTRWRDYGSDNMLLVANLNYLHILNSEFSFESEVKLINFNELLWEFELSADLGRGLSIFIKDIKHFLYDNPTVYTGFKFESSTRETGKLAENYITKIKMKPRFYLNSEEYKGILEQEVYFDFFRKEKSRFLLGFNINVPVFRGQKFFGTFRPENISYPITFEYERRLKENLFLGLYCTNRIEMPFDVDKEAKTSVSLGVLLKNQPYFEKIEKQFFRYELFAGRHFTHGHEAGINLGLNTIQRKINLGAEARIWTNSDYSQESVELFISFGKEINLRPFVGWQRRHILTDGKKEGCFFFGITFLVF